MTCLDRRLHAEPLPPEVKLLLEASGVPDQWPQDEWEFGFSARPRLGSGTWNLWAGFETLRYEAGSPRPLQPWTVKGAYPLFSSALRRVQNLHDPHPVLAAAVEIDSIRTLWLSSYGGGAALRRAVPACVTA